MKPDTEAAIREWNATAEGWCQIDRALEMAQLIIDNPPQYVVEIGVFAGGSLIPQALAMKELSQESEILEPAHIYGIDPWSREAALEQVFVADDHTPPADEEVARKWWAEVDLDKMHLLAMQGIWRYGLERHAIVIRAASQDCAQLFREIDILYIDGNHSEKASCRDVELYLPRLRPGGFLWFDDAHWLSTQRAIQKIEEACVLERDREAYRLYRKNALPLG